MNRRGFLQGVFGGITSAGLIVAASRAEVEAFASPLAREAPILVDQPAASAVPDISMHLYNAQGECVAVVTRIEVTTEPMWYGDGSWLMAISGQKRIDIHAQGIGSVEWSAQDHHIALRGFKP